MPKPSESLAPTDDWEEHRRRVIGLGENSFRKSYYPELQRKVVNVKNLVQAIEHSPHGVFVSLRDGEVEYANQTLLRLCGCAGEVLIGQRPHALWRHVTEGEGAAAILERMARGETWSGDLLIDTGDGAPRWVDLNVTPITDDHGDITHFLGSMEDTSARKQAEAELKAIAQARAQALAEAEHLSALKSEFIANMSHELRTPIFQILGLARLSERASDIERAHLQAQKIRESGERLMQIVESLLDFSAAESGQLALHPAPFSLSGLLDDIASKWLDRAAAKGLVLAIDTTPLQLPTITADRQRLQQLLDELLGNALKFTQHGQITLSVALTANSLDISVADSGIGMSPEQVAKCLSAFVQGDGSATRSFGGMGLGLALCKHLVDLMQGQIAVDSEPGRGTTFRVRLPQG